MARSVLILVLFAWGSAAAAELRGTVTDSKSLRLLGATVLLEAADGTKLDRATDRNGAFAFEALPAGRYLLTVVQPGFAPQTVDVDVDDEPVTVRFALDELGVSSKITAIAPNPDGYEAPDAAAALRMNVALIDTPVSVQVVPKRVIEDQSALGLEEIYTNISGVTQAGSTLNAQTEIRPIIRGFEAEVPLRNGLRATTVGAVDPINIESVEVLKGPASILYGAVEPGGVLNYTTKKPLLAPRYELVQQFGSNDHQRTTLDATGPLNERRTLAYRINAAYQSNESFRDFIELERTAVAPSLTYRPSERGELFFDVSYTRETVPYDSGVPFGLDDEPLVPVSTFFGDPSLAGRELDDTFSSLRYFHTFSEHLTLRSQFQYHRADSSNESIRHRGIFGSVGNEQLGLRYQDEDRSDQDYQLVTDVITQFEIGSTRHEAIVGFDLAYQDSLFERYRLNLPNLPITDDPQVSVNLPPTRPIETITGETQWGALYVQDQISALEDDRLKILVGARWDTSEAEADREGVNQPDVEADAITGRFGIGYKLDPRTLLFASFSQSFVPQAPGTLDVNDELLDPERGEQYELGVKLELFDRRSLLSISTYDIRKDNVPLLDIPQAIATGILAFFPGVSERSRGVDLDFSGRITDELSLIASYAFIDAEISENELEPELIGRRLGNVPEQFGRFWLAYDGDDFGVGGGLQYVSDQVAQFDEFELDSYTVAELGIWFRVPLADPDRRLRVQLNIDNLLDDEYYARASDRSIVHPGAPRSAIFQVGLEF